MEECEVVLGVSQRDSPWVVSAFFRSGDFEDQIEIRWAFATLWVSWDLFGLEISFWEFSQAGDAVKDISIFIIDTDVVINGVIASLLGPSWEESKLSFKGTEGLFAAELSLLIGEDEVPQEQNISNGQSRWIVFDILGEQEDSELLIGERAVDDFEPHAVIFFDILAIGVGGIGDNT